MIDICSSATSFVNQDIIYKQIFGTHMGSSLSPVIGNMVMEKLEEKVMKSFHSPPFLRFRYVGDVFAIMESELRSIPKKIFTALFTREEESEESLTFLNALVTRTLPGLLHTAVVRSQHTLVEIYLFLPPASSTIKAKYSPNFPNSPDSPDYFSSRRKLFSKKKKILKNRNRKHHWDLENQWLF